VARHPPAENYIDIRLLRDSYHIGVAYGHYDLRRLIVSLVVGVHETGDPVLAINQGGWHAAESLIIARCWFSKF
jgi:hypothetical protein